MSDGPDARGVTNPGVRAAVEAFAENPSAERSLDVLRACLYGELLLDVTGSDLTYEDGQIAQGSTIQVAGTTGPDGSNALVAYTSQEQLALAHEDGEDVQSLVQPAVGVLEFTASQDHAWLYVDPAGPSTCALSREEIDFALRVPRNDAVRDAVALAAGDPEHTPALVAALRAEGQLVLATGSQVPVDGDEAVAEDAQVQIATSELPDGGQALLVFTSGPEAAARLPGDGLVVLTTAEVLDLVTGGELGGIVVNAAGPWVALTTEQLQGATS